jgi:tRNA A58 N-methylase Trm61
MPARQDPFGDIRTATLSHLRRHGCGCYPFFDGSLLGAIAGAAQARRIVELGTALGYTACWFAQGAPDARIDTIDFDADHVRLARSNIEAAGFAKRVTVHEGAFDDVLPQLKPGYDVAFFDGFDPTLAQSQGTARAAASPRRADHHQSQFRRRSAPLSRAARRPQAMAHEFRRRGWPHRDQHQALMRTTR